LILPSLSNDALIRTLSEHIPFSIWMLSNEWLFLDCYKKTFSFNLEKWRRSNSLLLSWKENTGERRKHCRMKQQWNIWHHMKQ